MERKKGINFFFAIIAIITGSKLYKHFNFADFTFEKPTIDIIYAITFVACVIFLVRDYVRGKGK